MSLDVSVGKQNDDWPRWQPAWEHVPKPHVDNLEATQWISLSGCTTCSSFSLKSGYIILRSTDIFPSGQSRNVMPWHHALCQLVQDTVVPAKANSVRAPVLLCQACRKKKKGCYFSPPSSNPALQRHAAMNAHHMFHVLFSALFPDEVLVFGLLWKAAANKHRVGNISYLRAVGAN